MDARTGQFVPVIGETLKLEEEVTVKGIAFLVVGIEGSTLTLKSKRAIETEGFFRTLSE